jgi:hypothetical protein
MFDMDLADYTYNTAEEARAVAANLGLDDVHKVRKKGTLMFRPGVDDQELRDAIGGGGPMGGSGSSSGMLGFPDEDDDENDTGPFGFL